MDDADTALNGVTDSIKPWTIKSVASEVRDLAIIAARKEGLTVGQWLERVIRAATAESDGQSLIVSPPRSAPVSLQSDQVGLRELVAMARELTPPEKDSEAMKLARSVVRDRLRALRSG